MVRTRVGYTGGTTADPTYHSLGDHTESVQVDFDPARISYQRLLEVFWSSHDPCSVPWKTQYKNVLFYHGPEQKRLALAGRGAEAHTEVRPAGRFYRAEDYHQKYYLRQEAELMREFSRMLPDPAAFADSTAAARVNGWLGGHGTREEVDAEVDRLGLSPEAVRLLRSRVGAAR